MCLSRYQTENMPIQAIMMYITEHYIQNDITAGSIIQEGTARIQADTAIILRRTAAILTVRSVTVQQIHITAIQKAYVSQAYSQEALRAAV